MGILTIDVQCARGVVLVSENQGGDESRKFAADSIETIAPPEMARLLGCRIGEVQKVPLFCGDNGCRELILVHRRLDELFDVRLSRHVAFLDDATVVHFLRNAAERHRV